MKHASFHPGEMVVSRKNPDIGYLFCVIEMHPPSRHTWNKPTVTVRNMRPLIPIQDPDLEQYDKRCRRGELFTYLAEEMQPFHQPAQMRLIL